MVREGAGAQPRSGDIILALAWKKWAPLSSIQPLTEQRPAKDWNQQGLKSLLWVGIGHCSQVVSCLDYALTLLLTVWQRNFHGHCNPLMTSLSHATTAVPNINPELTFVLVYMNDLPSPNGWLVGPAVSARSLLECSRFIYGSSAFIYLEKDFSWLSIWHYPLMPLHRYTLLLYVCVVGVSKLCLIQVVLS